MHPACFIVPGRIASADFCRRIELQLSPCSASALAILLPLLGCGEEAAALAFDGLAVGTDDGEAAHILRTIAREERVHDSLMRGLMEILPTPPDRSMMMRRAQRFHVQLGLGGRAVHLARIAALDAAVCIILSRLVRPALPLAADVQICRTLTRIRNDEARHVRWSRRLALTEGPTRAQRDAAAGSRDALANVLALAADAFELLSVDPAILDRDVRALPNGLLTP